MSNEVRLFKCAVWMALLIMPGLVAAEQQAFFSGSLEQIERRFAGEPFLLVLWSADCAPCRTELAILGETSRRRPEMNFVLVATDNLELQPTLIEILDEYGLGDAESWIFADPNVERLRYSIDPNWFGELPRSYFYDRNSNRTGVSGQLSRDRIIDWLKT